MKPHSKLATVMSQLFPFFVGGTFDLKEIIANKDSIVAELRRLGTKLQTNILWYSEHKQEIVAHEWGMVGGIELDVNDNDTWNWFSRNFLYLLFSKVKGNSETPDILGVFFCAAEIVRLYQRFNVRSALSLEQQDSVLNTLTKLETYFIGNESGSMSINLEDVLLAQTLLNEWMGSGIYPDTLYNSEAVWVIDAKNRINRSIDGAIEYLSLFV